MPKPITRRKTYNNTNKLVMCRVCRKYVQDEGLNQSCPRCGSSPVPSHDYPKDHIMHPNYTNPNGEALR